MRSFRAPFAAAAAVALATAAPAMAQTEEAPTASSPSAPVTSAPSDSTNTAASTTPANASGGPSVKLLGATIQLTGVESGVAISARDGQVRSFASPTISINSGRPLEDTLAGIALSNLATAGDRFIGSTFDRLDINIQEGKTFINASPRTDSIAYQSRDDTVFGPAQFLGRNLNRSETSGSPTVGIGVDMQRGGIGVALIEGQKPNDRTAWRLHASAGLEGLNAGAEIRHRLTGDIRLHGVVGTDGIGARISYDRRIADQFRISAQGSVTSRYGVTAGLQGTYTSGNTSVTLGFDSERGGTAFTAITRGF